MWLPLHVTNENRSKIQLLHFFYYLVPWFCGNHLPWEEWIPLLVPTLSNLTADSNAGKEDMGLPFNRWQFFKGAKWLTPDRTGICNFLVALAVLRCTQGQSESNSIFLLWFASCHKLKVAYKLFCCCCWGNERGDCAFRGVLQEVNFFWWHWNMLF